MNLKPPKKDRVDLLGIEIDNVTFEQTLSETCRLVDQKMPSYIVTPNVDHLITLQEDHEFREIYRNADLVVPDGMPLLWAARFLKTPLKEKVSGSDLFPAICKLAAGRGYKLFFLGGRPGVSEKAKAILEKQYPAIRIAGTYSPPLGFENDQQELTNICLMIRETAPDILFVGLGTPKQEKFIAAYKDLLRVPISIGIGASFDFIAGTLKRAPIWMQRAGLEWLHRLIREPQRLFKRYVYRDMKFFILVYRQRMNKLSG